VELRPSELLNCGGRPDAIVDVVRFAIDFSTFQFVTFNPEATSSIVCFVSLFMAGLLKKVPTVCCTEPDSLSRGWIFGWDWKEEFQAL
jgi:hypothetical protein